MKVPGASFLAMALFLSPVVCLGQAPDEYLRVVSVRSVPGRSMVRVVVANAAHRSINGFGITVNGSQYTVDYLYPGAATSSGVAIAPRGIPAGVSAELLFPAAGSTARSGAVRVSINALLTQGGDAAGDAGVLRWMRRSRAAYRAEWRHWLLVLGSGAAPVNDAERAEALRMLGTESASTADSGEASGEAAARKAIARLLKSSEGTDAASMLRMASRRLATAEPDVPGSAEAGQIISIVHGAVASASAPHISGLKQMRSDCAAGLRSVSAVPLLAGRAPSAAPDLPEIAAWEPCAVEPELSRRSAATLCPADFAAAASAAPAAVTVTGMMYSFVSE